jgi:hypothetical protein
MYGKQKRLALAEQHAWREAFSLKRDFSELKAGAG